MSLIIRLKYFYIFNPRKKIHGFGLALVVPPHANGHSFFFFQIGLKEYLYSIYKIIVCH